MLLSIDEVVNMTPDQTIVLYGFSANVFDLPANAQSQGNLAAFLGSQNLPNPFFIEQGFWLIAPSTTSDTEPPSVAMAKGLFPGFFVAKSIAYWPVAVGTDPQPVIPAYKQGLVSTAFTNLTMPGPWGTWIFVVAPSGDMTAQLVQLVTYQSVGPAGTIQVGPNTWLGGVNEQWGPQYGNQEPPDFTYALNTVTWKIKSGNFNLQTVMELIDHPEMGYYRASDLPQSWGQGVSQTTLLSAASTPLDVDWVDGNDGPQVAGFTPSSPIFHLSLLAGSSLTFKRPWLQDYAANLISYPATAASAWDDIMACCLLVLKIAVDASGELPWPVGGIVDYCFDEAMEHVDPGFDPPIPHWLQ